MSCTKLEDVLTDNLKVVDTFVFYKPTNMVFCFQTEFMVLKPYGLPKKDDFHKTEESRRYFQVPLFDSLLATKMEELDEFFEDKVGYNYTPIVKKSKNENYPDYVKVKFDDSCHFTLINENGSVKILSFSSVDELREQIKFYYEVRFILSCKPWSYMGKSGVSLRMSHVQGRAPEQNHPMPTDFV